MGRGHVALVSAVSAAAVVASVVAPAGAGAVVPSSPVVAGSKVGATVAPAAYLARTAAGTRRFASSLDPADAAVMASVDFRRFAVVAVAAPFPSCGWVVGIRGLVRGTTVLRVRYAARGPAKGMVVCAAETTAYAVVRVPRARVAGVLRAVPVSVG